jgi:hypothetical protein
MEVVVVVGGGGGEEGERLVQRERASSFGSEGRNQIGSEDG